MLQMWPRPRAFISFRARRVTNIAPLVLMSIVRLMSASVWSAKRLLFVMMPAQLIRMSTAPQSARVARQAASTDSGEEMSAR